MRINNAIIPGMMPLPETNSRNIIKANPYGGINAVIHTKDANTPAPKFNLLLTDRCENTLYSDPLGQSVFQSGDDFRFITDPAKEILPVGTTYLKALIDDKRHTFYVMHYDSAFQSPKYRELEAVPSNVSQSGSVLLDPGIMDVTVVFPKPFVSTPSIVLVAVYPDVDATPSILILADVPSRTPTRFTARLTVATNSGGYRLGWAAWV